MKYDGFTTRTTCTCGLCPICQWRRSLKLYSQISQAMRYVSSQGAYAYAYAMARYPFCIFLALQSIALPVFVVSASTCNFTSVMLQYPFKLYSQISQAMRYVSSQGAYAYAFLTLTVRNVTLDGDRPSCICRVRKYL